MILFPPDKDTWRQAFNGAQRGKVSALFNCLRYLCTGWSFKTSMQGDLQIVNSDRGDLRDIERDELQQVGFGGKQIELIPVSLHFFEQAVTVNARPGMSYITAAQLLRGWCSAHENVPSGYNFCCLHVDGTTDYTCDE